MPSTARATTGCMAVRTTAADTEQDPTPTAITYNRITILEVVHSRAAINEQIPTTRNTTTSVHGEITIPTPERTERDRRGINGRSRAAWCAVGASTKCGTLHISSVSHWHYESALVGGSCFLNQHCACSARFSQ